MVCDVGLVQVPNTNQAAPKKEIVKTIRGEPKARLDAIYKDWTRRAKQAAKVPAAIG